MLLKKHEKSLILADLVIFSYPPDTYSYRICGIRVNGPYTNQNSTTALPNESVLIITDIMNAIISFPFYKTETYSLKCPCSSHHLSIFQRSRIFPSNTWAGRVVRFTSFGYIKLQTKAQLSDRYPRDRNTPLFL